MAWNGRLHLWPPTLERRRLAPIPRTCIVPCPTPPIRSLDYISPTHVCTQVASQDGIPTMASHNGHQAVRRHWYTLGFVCRFTAITKCKSMGSKINKEHNIHVTVCVCHCECVVYHDIPRYTRVCMGPHCVAW